MRNFQKGPNISSVFEKDSHELLILKKKWIGFPRAVWKL